MAHTSLTSLFSDIADAIRAKTGSSATIVADNFPAAIANISAGTVATATQTISGSNSLTITFSVSGEPQAWAIMLTTAGSVYGSGYYVAAQYDGITVNAWTKDGSFLNSGITSSYENGALTITAAQSNYKYWHNGTWSLIYTY